MESENTFHLKKKPSAPIPQYVNPGKARKEASRRRAFRSLPRERFLCRLGPFRPPHEIHRRDGSQPTVPCGSFRTGGHVPFCVLQSHSSGVEYIFPTPSLPMEFFILLLVLGLLSGMVFTFVKACQVVSLEQKVRTLETEVSELKERLNSRSSPQRPPAETRKSLPPPVESPVQPIRTLPAAAPVREPACALPSRHSLQPVRNARPAPSRPASFSWEYFIGAKLLSWIGGFVLFLGTGFFVKYSIDNDLISPEWRVTLTYLAAAGLLGAGLSRLRKKYPILSGTLTSTGILVLYLATCAGRMFYELPFFTTAIATVLLAATTAAAFILAVRLRFRIIAFLGIIGGFLTPVILSTGQDHTASLFLYMTILNAGLLAVVAATRWTGAGGTGLAAYTILLMGWFDEYGGPSHILAVVILSICTLLLYGGYGLYAGTRQAEPDRKGGPFLLAFCAIAVTCLTAFRLQAECSFRFLSPSSHLLLLLAGMLPMIALLPLARAKSTYWSCFLPMGLFTIFYFYQSSAEEASQSALWISSQLQGLFCLFMIPASYAVLSARTPSGGAYLAELQPGVRISCFATAALAWLLVMHPLSPSPFYVFLTAATFCGMAAWHRRGQALMAAAAGYTIAASYQDIHPAGSAVIFLAIFLLPLLLCGKFPLPRLAWTGFFLLAFLFVRNGLSQAFVQLDPAGMQALRTMFATMVFCCMAGAWWVQKKVTPRLPGGRSSGLRVLVAALNIFGAILLFIWMNTEISCGFAAPGDRPLMIQFGSSVAQDLTISIAWSLFALGLIATGFDIRSSRVRMAGLALLGITLLKVVCYDISSLGQLYRVGALVGLAAIVLISSFLYQKFTMKLRNKKKSQGEAPKS